MLITPAISPVYYNNPAFTILELSPSNTIVNAYNKFF